MGPFAFLAGLFSLGASAGMSIKQDMENERQVREREEKHYSYPTQSRYDYNASKLYGAYDILAMTERILEEYPRMSYGVANEIAEASVAKKLMEAETPFKYEPSMRCQYFDLDKYATDEFKRDE